MATDWPWQGVSFCSCSLERCRREGCIGQRREPIAAPSIPWIDAHRQPFTINPPPGPSLVLIAGNGKPRYRVKAGREAIAR